MGNSINFQAARLRICVDQTDKGRIAGQVVSMRLEKPLLFRDIGDLLLQMDALLDRQKFPLAFQRKRSFRQEEPLPRFPERINEETYMTEEEVENAHGAIATFEITVVSRQNTSWQGRLDWLDGQPPQSYESALELIRMIDTRMSPTEN